MDFLLWDKMSQCDASSDLHSKNITLEATWPQNHHTAPLIQGACLSGYWVATEVFELITPRRASKDDWRKPWMEDISDFINISCLNSIPVFSLHGF